MNLTKPHPSEVLPVSRADFPRLVEVWEASVRATHDFLTEDDIQFFKPIVRDQAFDAVDLRCIRAQNGEIVGFVGVHDAKVEMLFIHPDWRGVGTGRTLLQYAVREMNAVELDVNEDNHQAVDFYLHMGFVVTSRSDVDGMGLPFPLLHMRLAGLEDATP